jgi:predicted DNA-binding transcriptional regulator AlpA
MSGTKYLTAAERAGAASKVWTRDQVLALGVRTDVETAGDIFGLSRTQAYEAVNHDRFPVPTFRIGRRVVVPVAPIVKLLALETEAAGPPSPAAADEQTARADERPDETHGKPKRLRAAG